MGALVSHEPRKEKKMKKVLLFLIPLHRRGEAQLTHMASSSSTLPYPLPGGQEQGTLGRVKVVCVWERAEC